MKRIASGSLLGLILWSALVYAQVAAPDYSWIYEAANPAIVSVTTDDGAGSGFLVSPLGHIATNFHVIRNSRYLAVQFADGRKFKAVVVAVNPHFDMAMLKVNSAAVADIRPLPLLPAEKESSIKVGIPVVALGCPLDQRLLMTQGILSKVEELTLLGDFLLQAGNSGGPLLNTGGDVIGINTFGEANLAGAIRVGVLRAFVESPQLIESITIEPPPNLLPSISSERYPVEILNRKIETEPLDWDAYRLKAGDFTVTAITPVLIGKLQVMQEKARETNRYQRRSKNISDSAYHGIEGRFYEWHRATEFALDYAVIFDIRPESGLTPRSRFAKILAPFFMLGRTGKLDMEFKGEFLDFRIYRDGELIEPIMPGRQVIEGNTEQKKSRFIDQAYSGSYVYSPDEFLTGSEFRMEIIDARKPDEIHKQLNFTADSKLIRQIRSDFTFSPDLISRVP